MSDGVHVSHGERKGRGDMRWVLPLSAVTLHTCMCRVGAANVARRCIGGELRAAGLDWTALLHSHSDVASSICDSVRSFVARPLLPCSALVLLCVSVVVFAMSAACCYWRCTYTGQLSKKHPTFVDGFVRLSCNGCKLTLLAADGDGRKGGRELDSSIRAAPFTLHTDDELRLEGHIVRIDEPVVTLHTASTHTQSSQHTQTAAALHFATQHLPGTSTNDRETSARPAGLPRRSTFRPPARLAPKGRTAAEATQRDPSTNTANTANTEHTAHCRNARPRLEPDWSGGLLVSAAGRTADVKSARTMLDGHTRTGRAGVDQADTLDSAALNDPWHDGRSSPAPLPTPHSVGGDRKCQCTQ